MVQAGICRTVGRPRNVLSERDPDEISWQTLPNGDFGLRAPPGGGPIAEEQSYVALSDGSFCCVYRSDREFRRSQAVTRRMLAVTIVREFQEPRP